MNEFMNWPFPSEAPEFGNVKHIKAVKDHIRAIADEESLRDYNVTINFSGSTVVTVRAHDEAEAWDSALDEAINLRDIELDKEVGSVIDVTEDSND